ncbi:MAG: hypothetical protein RIR01_2285 [Bacteroidota bacterium]|jgi:hypothetical protein
MCALKTKGVAKSGVSKELRPGNRVARIFSIALTKPAFAKEGTPEFYLEAVLEGEHLDNFEGFDIEFGKPEKGKFKGQSAKVKLSKYTFKDFKKKDGEVVPLEEQVMQLLHRLATALGNPGWLDSMDGKCDNIQQLVGEFNRNTAFKQKYLNWCLGGKEKTVEVNGKFYPRYYLHVPPYKDRAGVVICETPYADPKDTSTTVTVFNKDLHVEKEESAQPSAAFNSTAEFDANDEFVDVEDNATETTTDSAFEIDDDAFSIDDDSFEVEDAF